MRYRHVLEHSWDAFNRRRENEPPVLPKDGLLSIGSRPDRLRMVAHNVRRIMAPILTHIAIDVAGVEIRHARVNDEGVYEDDIDSLMNECFQVSPNLDQGPAQFRQDAVFTMLNEGLACVVPVETTLNPEQTGGFDIKQLRVGVVREWFPEHVRVEVYNQQTGRRQEVVLRKDYVAIVENPFYEIMNEFNSTLQRLIHKLAQLDVTDDRLAAGKLDIILQLPYTVKSETRMDQAQKRIRNVEDQMMGSKYGISYIDATERITQLNRPSENNLLQQTKDLEKRLYDQMGLTEEVFLGTASEEAMLNYYNRTVFPIVRAFREEYERKFLTKTARTKRQSFVSFRNPFDLVPVSQIAEIADKFTRNEIMSPNEFRPIVGLKPVKDAEANELRNRNMPKVEDTPADVKVPPNEESGEDEA